HKRGNGLLLSLIPALVLAGPAAAGLLTAQGAAVLDGSGGQRASFSTNEKIGFQQVVNNGVASTGRISFQFSVAAPNGNIVFRHLGNSVRGTAGNAASQILGMTITSFFQGPGLYTMKADATLDGVTVEQVQTFTISSPNILLIYPPNAASGLTDNPLTFQWYSSGASSYRVTVGDNASLYNALFIQTTPVGTLTYPQNPADPRQRLASGQLYWWKVEGLDAGGGVVAQSPSPFSFSVVSTVLTRDLAVTALDVVGAPDPAGNINFSVTVNNQGNTTESNIPLRVTVGGLSAPESPLTLPQMSPGDARTVSVHAPIPTDQKDSLAIACLAIFDDTVGNNCKTLAVARAGASGGENFASSSSDLTGDQIWQAIAQILKERGIDLEDFRFLDMEGNLSRDDLAALLDQLRQGQAQVSLSGPPLAAAAPVFAPVTLTPPPSDESGALLPAAPLSSAEEAVVAGRDWSGHAAPLSGQSVTFAVTKEDKWERLWRRLSSDSLPVVRFADHMVLALIAGSSQPCDRIQIEDMRTSSSELY
ncbi:MAG: CARDB domain-containing protein, partial [Elusimicrobiota bacterium]